MSKQQEEGMQTAKTETENESSTSSSRESESNCGSLERRGCHVLHGGCIK